MQCYLTNTEEEIESAIFYMFIAYLDLKV